MTKTISPKDLNKLIKNNQAILVDVRERFEHDAVHIKDSVLIPSSNFNEKGIPASNGKKIIFYCRTGRRAANIISKLNRNKEYYNLEGGIEAWIESGFNCIKCSKKYLPLDRQVQLTIGLILIFNSFLSYFVSLNFIFLALIIGTGLTVAGATGFCGLAILVAKAPWNKISTQITCAK